MKKPTAPFLFKQFAVEQSKDVFKVNTDGCLLGAVVCNKQLDFENSPTKQTSILDIGTGTGVIALMLAQCYNGNIDAIDINPIAVSLATQNFIASKWRERISAKKLDVNEIVAKDNSYQLIVSNPPFFSNSHKSPYKLNNQAKHNDTLKPEKLLHAVHKLLDTHGHFFTILPSNEVPNFLNISNLFQLNLKSITHIKPLLKKSINRNILQFCKTKVNELDEKEMIIRDSKGGFTSAYTNLLKDFYTKI